MLFEKIQEVVAQHLDCEIEEVKRESTFESLGIDSLDSVELVMELEESLGIQLDLDKDLETIDELVKFVEERM
ncbi:MAG: phosphopantetheine-binding protein [Clostridia bacterium]|nr:phosphopantetheine-binding protein [Clostridia bacterium]